LSQDEEGSEDLNVFALAGGTDDSEDEGGSGEEPSSSGSEGDWVMHGSAAAAGPSHAEWQPSGRAGSKAGRQMGDAGERPGKRRAAEGSGSRKAAKRREAAGDDDDVFAPAEEYEHMMGEGARAAAPAGGSGKVSGRKKVKRAKKG
jgi:hypothetical protein